MNILCPNCQRPLTVQEQYAGQLMKCPLCGGTFTVPALAPMPAAPVSPPASAPASPSPFSETWPPSSQSAPPPQPMETYGLSSPPAAPERPKMSEPHYTPAPPPEPPPRHEQRPWEMREPEPAGEGLEVVPRPPPPTPPEGYTHRFSLSINPRILPWIAPAAFVLIFFLTLPPFNWVGMYPGGYGVYTQNGWQAAFGTYSEDDVWEAKVLKKDTTGSDKPSFGFLPFFYLLVLLPTVFVAVASVLVHLKMIPINLPPVAQQYWWLRPLAVAGIAGFAFFFLFLIIAVGFPLESKVHQGAEDAAKDFVKNPQTPDEHKALKLQAARIASSYNPHRTFAFRLVVILHLLALVSLGLEFWMERRGNRPAPRMDVMW